MRPPAAAALIALVLLSGCRSGSGKPDPEPAPPPGRACRATLDEETRRYLDENQELYVHARRAGREWLDGLEVDHIELRRHGIKGKKKVVEHLDAYAWLLRDPLPGEREELEARFAAVAELTRDPSFHDMDAVDDRQFKQDATSYMRAAYLMDRQGLDVSRYVEEIRRVQPRFDAHMTGRGPAQRMIFHIYYSHFGLEEPFPLEEAFETGTVAARPDPAGLERMQIYHLTHEIFMPYRYGEVRESDFFSGADREYLARALPVLVRRRIGERDPDLVGELVLCMEYLDLEADPAYREGIEFLLASQNADGSWGSYPRADRRFGDLAVYHVYLHTTKLALTALVDAFRCPDA